jgi:monoamine oxidase
LPEAVIERAREQLVSMYGRAAADSGLVAVEHKSWCADQWTNTDAARVAMPGSEGVTATVPAGAAQLPLGSTALRAPLLGGRLVLAGTETEAEMGHMEGAVLSAERAALLVGRVLLLE